MSNSSRLPENPNLNINYNEKSLEEIWLAGGCFWGVDAFMRRVKGIAATTVGYANGETLNPSYEDVCKHSTGHAEAVHVKYDPAIISLEGILQEFFGIIDPTSFNRQGNDVGSQYRSGIYYKNEEDEMTIRTFVESQKSKYKKPIVTEIKPLEHYFIAEEYHQSYLEKNPNGYCHIKF